MDEHTIQNCSMLSISFSICSLTTWFFFILTRICKSKRIFHLIFQEDNQQDSFVLPPKLGIFLNIILVYQIPNPSNPASSSVHSVRQS